MTPSPLPSARRLVAPIAAAKLVLHLVWAQGYGCFRDELYYLACARHLENPWVMPYEDHLRFYVCRHPHEPLGERWPKVKHYE